MFNRRFVKDAAERAVATFAQALLAFLLVAETTIMEYDWSRGLGLGATAAVISVLKSVVATKLTDNTISPASLVEDKVGV